MQHFGVSGVRSIAQVVFSEPLKSRQEVLIEVGELIRLFDVSLNKLQDVTSHSFHRLDHRLILLVHEGLTDALRIHAIHAE